VGALQAMLALLTTYDLVMWCLAAGFLAVVLSVFGAADLLTSDPVARRMAGGRPSARREPNAPSAHSAFWFRLRRDRQRGTKMTHLQAGSGTAATHRFLAIRLTFAIAIPLGFVLAALLWGAGRWAMSTLGVAALMGVVAYVLPARWQARRAARRRQAIVRGFPDALDMMVVCVEAGLGLDAALNRVAAQIATAHPALGAELALVALELRVGTGRDVALRNLSRRTGVPELASFATLLVQSDALGTGIAQALRVQADEMRATRLLRAEELAHALPVKLTLPLVFLILPAMLAVVLLPGLITIARDVLPHLSR
jgi:pilus assembly protein TadC